MRAFLCALLLVLLVFGSVFFLVEVHRYMTVFCTFWRSAFSVTCLSCILCTIVHCMHAFRLYMYSLCHSALYACFLLPYAWLQNIHPYLSFFYGENSLQMQCSNR